MLLIIFFLYCSIPSRDGQISVRNLKQYNKMSSKLTTGAVPLISVTDITHIHAKNLQREIVNYLIKWYSAVIELHHKYLELSA